MSQYNFEKFFFFCCFFSLFFFLKKKRFFDNFVFLVGGYVCADFFWWDWFLGGVWDIKDEPKVKISSCLLRKGEAKRKGGVFFSFFLESCSWHLDALMNLVLFFFLSLSLFYYHQQRRTSPFPLGGSPLCICHPVVVSITLWLKKKREKK